MIDFTALPDEPILLTSPDDEAV